MTKNPYLLPWAVVAMLVISWIVVREAVLMVQLADLRQAPPTTSMASTAPRVRDDIYQWHVHTEQRGDNTLHVAAIIHERIVYRFVCIVENRTLRRGLTLEIDRLLLGPLGGANHVVVHWRHNNTPGHIWGKRFQTPDNHHYALFAEDAHLRALVVSIMGDDSKELTLELELHQNQQIIAGPFHVPSRGGAFTPDARSLASALRWIVDTGRCLNRSY